MMTNKIRVNVSSYKDRVEIDLMHGEFSGIHFCTVYKPNFIERLFGITFESKIQKTVKKAQKKADKLNLEEEFTNKVVCKLGFGDKPHKHGIEKSTHEEIQEIRKLEQELDIPVSLRMELQEYAPMQDGYQ